MERDAFRRRRALKVFCTMFGIGLIFVLFVGTIVAYFMLQPKPPTFQYEAWNAPRTLNKHRCLGQYTACIEEPWHGTIVACCSLQPMSEALPLRSEPHTTDVQYAPLS